MYVAGNGRGGRFKTKAALKAHVAAGGEIDLLGGWEGPSYTSDAMPEGQTFTVAGPSEFVAHTWYATIRKTNGKVKVS